MTHLLKKCSQILGLFCMINMISVAYAGRVYFKNGDIMSGEITQITDKNITIKPDFNPASKIEIARDLLEQFQATQALTIELEDGAIKEGSVIVKDDQLIQIDEDKEFDGSQKIAKAYIESYEAHHGFHHKGHIKSGLTAVSGNSENSVFDVNAHLESQKEALRLTSDLEYGFSEDNNTTTRDRTLARLKSDYFFSDKVYGFANADFERDVIQNLSLRTAYGGGLGYQFYKQEDLNLNLEAGINQVIEDYNALASEDTELIVLRWGIKYDQKFFSKMVFYHNQRGLQFTDDFSHTVINARTGVNMPIWDQIQAGFEWRLDWNNNPTPGNNTADHTYIANIGYHF